MNIPGNSRTIFCIMSVLALALWCGAGCQSTAYKKSDAAANSLERAAAEVQAETREIDVTLEALNDLVTNPAPDLKPQFVRFNTALDRLTASAQQTDATRLRMEQKSTEYFTAWDQQVPAINFGVIRERSEARRAEVTNHFYSVNSRYLDAQAVVWPLINYFKDIRKALSVDLTSAGLASVKDIVNNAGQNTRKVQLALAQLTNELKMSSAQLSSVTPRSPSPLPLETTASASSE